MAKYLSSTIVFANWRRRFIVHTVRAKRQRR